MANGQRQSGGDRQPIAASDDLGVSPAAETEARRGSGVPIRHVNGWWLHDWAPGGDWINIAEVYENDAYRIDQVPPYRENEVIVDVGANVGAFSRKAHERNPTARLIALEAAPENIPVLRKNVGEYAQVVEAAVTYEHSPTLLNTVFPGSANTGASIVCRPNDNQPTADPRYRLDLRPLAALTVEEIIDAYRIDRIDILKLDCEGSEFSILENTACLDRIEMIVGEYHGWERFNDLCIRRFRPDWHLTVLQGGPFGIFWLNRWHNVKRNGVRLPPGYVEARVPSR